MDTMPEPTVVHHTFVLERSFNKPPEAVFAAFADAAKKRRWYAVGGNTEVENFEMDFRVGGAERIQYRFQEGSPFPGVELTNVGSYHDIVENKRIVTASTMAMGGRRFSTSLVTFELLPTANGTDLIVTHQGAFFEGADGPEMREQGWRKLLDNLGTLLAS
jgi:uncharacterized protein YndB with AHSA1/START domain